jgi:Kdo2-lipid IVA lauroyltransferase/acyltransferase
MAEHAPYRLYWPRAWGWCFVLGVLRALSRLSFGGRYRWGRRLGWLARRLVPRRERIMRANIKACFPEWSEQLQQQLIESHYASLGMGMIDTGLAWWGAGKSLEQALIVEGAEHLRAAQDTGRGILLVSAHFSQLDLLGFFLGTQCDYYAMVRPQKSGFLNAYAASKRCYASDVFYQHELLKCSRLLRSGEALLYFPDQDYGAKHSVFAPFFGVSCASVVATEKLTRISNAVVLPVFLVRDNAKERYRLIFEPMMSDFPREDPVASATAVNQVLERLVRRYPEQYLWGHRRFKTRPKGEVSLYS